MNDTNLSTILESLAESIEKLKLDILLKDMEIKDLKKELKDSINND